MAQRPGTGSRRRLEDVFYKVMNKFNNRQWKEFARNKNKGLNLPDYQIDDIRADYGSDVREQKYQMLSLWQRRNGRRATADYLENLVDNFLNPQLSEERSAALAEPDSNDVGNRHPSTDHSVTDAMQERHLGVTFHPESSHEEESPESLSPHHSSPPGSVTLHTAESLGLRAYSATTHNSDSSSARTDLPRRGSNGSHGPNSHYAHNDESLPLRAFPRYESSSSISSTDPTAVFQSSDVNETRGENTLPKAIVNQSRKVYCEPRNVPSKAKPHMHVPNIKHSFGPLVQLGNVQVNVTGKNAVGIQNNYYVDGQKKKKNPRPHETSQQLADYCARVGEIKIDPSRRDFYNEHLERPELIYRVTQQPKGAVLILNNSFPGANDERFGSDKDLHNMETLWMKLGCKTFLKTETTAAESIMNFKKFASSKQAYNSDFVVVVIMSHGGREKGEDVFYGADRQPVTVKQVLAIFNNINARRLQDTPKLFFFQFCRGADVDMGSEAPTRSEPVEDLFSSLQVTVCGTSGSGNDIADSQGIQTVRQPTVSDTFISFATQAGFRAFRNSQGGSWYINAITNIFMRHAHDQHICDLMTIVNNAVASKTAVNDEDRSVHEGKEMSDFTSTLRKKFYFFPGFPADNDDDDFF